MKQLSKFEIFKITIPAMVGYIPLGIAFGLFGLSFGLDGVLVVLTSLLVYAGSAEFLLVGMISAHAGLLEVFLAIFLINLRHCFYTMALLDDLKALKFKFYAIFALTDESFAILKAQNYIKNVQNYDMAVNLTLFLNQIYWVLGVSIGVFIGKNLKIDYAGIDFSLTALFVVLSYELYRQNKNYKVLLLGFIIGIAGLFIFSDKFFLMGTLLSATIFLLVFKRWL
ncbi:branched-chain amino acid transport protein, AzlC family [Campylobacter iguaniorum]|nr:branched-chain amino acid transport protein, AzlC family [Campylobacter iguaniorum]